MLENGVTHCLDALAEGATSSVRLVETALERIADPAGEGARIFTDVLADQAMSSAQLADQRRAAGNARRLEGLPISVKDLFDIAGLVTRAGSRFLAGEPPAAEDAEAVARLRAEGAIVVGRTNMTELAFSGLGLNPHYGTPLSPWDRTTRRIPGGSSSGAAVSVADGMSAAGLGSDTGGSVRIPAALCGLTGFKPTQATVSRSGSYPLSPTLDSIGVIAPTVGDCALLHAILSNTQVVPARGSAAARFVVPTNYVTVDMDTTVDKVFEDALARLSAAGATLERRHIAAFDLLPEMAKIGSYAGVEAWAAHRERLSSRQEDFDPRVAVRILAARNFPRDAAEQLHRIRHIYMVKLREILAEFDAMLMPTVPIVAPPIDALEDDESYAAANLLMLRNPTTINLLDGCAVSVPLARSGDPPVGLTIAGRSGNDANILDLAQAVAPIVSEKYRSNR